jgi:titin
MFDNLLTRAKATRLAAVLVALVLCLGVGGLTASTASAALGDHVAPQNVVAVASPDATGTYDVNVSWDPVDAADTHTVCADLDGQAEQCFGVDTTTQTTQTTFPGMTPGTYTATVSSLFYGCGCSDSTSTQVTIDETPVVVETPGTPEDVDTYVADGTVTVYFSPSSTGGDADTFEIAVGDLTTSVDGPYAYSVDFADVAPGTYPVSVTATNTAGTSAAATGSVYVTAASKPSAPRNLAVSEFKNASVSWAWDAPTDNGGADILGYDVAITFPDGDGTFEADYNGNYSLDSDWFEGEDLEWAAYDLPTDQGDFVITMTARNEAGNGASVASAPMAVPTSTIPSAPTSVVATSPWENTVTVTFGTPESDGGLAVEGYLVTVNGEERWLDATDERSWTFYGIPAGSYTASVVAYNNNQDEMGYSPAGTSAAVAVTNYVPPVVVTPPPVVVTPPPVVTPPVVVKPAAKAPSAPRSVAATTVKAGKVIVTFKAPAATNGAAVSGYVLTMAGQEKRVDAGTRSVSFAGITKGTYAAKVFAKNSAGASAAGTTSVFMSKVKGAANPLTLKFGMRGTTIVKLQAKLDMPAKAQTALFDAATRTAVLKWQKKHGKKQTAVVNAAMRSALGI